MKKIPLSAKNKSSNRGKFFALVDDEDYNELSKFNWSISNAGYAQRRVKIGNKVSTILMHRQIMGLTFGDSDYVDHINGNRLDNQKSNLRRCTHTQNLHNSKISKRNKSRAKGVFHQCSKYTTKNGIAYKYYWRASIMFNRQLIYLGLFPDTDEGFERAKNTYNKAAIKYYGQFAYLNP